MPAGRPPLYTNVEEMEKIIQAYFAECDPHWTEQEYWDYPFFGKGKSKWQDRSKPMVQMTRRVLTEQQPYTMAGLARRLQMDRKSLVNYRNKDEFFPTIKEARAKVEEFNELQLHAGRSVTGAIFNLKVNFDYHENTDDQPPAENPIVIINNIPIGTETDET